MFDFETLRNEMLIEQRERYENTFLNMIDIEKSRELDFMINKAMFDYSFDIEKHDMQLRDLKLIEEYEFTNQDSLNQESIEKDSLDIIIELFDEDEYYLGNGDFYEEDIPFYEDNIFDNLYEEPIIFESAYYDNTMIGYIKDDDPFDYLDGYDYPEQPSQTYQDFNEYLEIDYDDFEDLIEFELNCDYFDEKIEENSNLEKLIEEYLEEEKNYIQYIMEYEPKEVITIDGETIILI